METANINPNGMSKLPAGTESNQPLVGDPALAAAYAQQIRDYKGKALETAKSALLAYVEAGANGTMEQHVEGVQSALKDALGNAYVAPREDAASPADLAKLPSRPLPFIRDPDLSHAVELELSALDGKQLAAAQQAVRDVRNSGLIAPLPALVSAYTNAIREAVAKTAH